MSEMDGVAAAQRRFGEIVQALADEPGVRLQETKGFGFGGLTVTGKLFATPRGETLLLKLPAPRVAELIAAGEGAAFDAGKGKPMREWVLALPHAAWPDLAREALAFVGAGRR